MSHFILTLMILLSAVSGAATPQAPGDLTDILVYGAEGIRAHSSDYQGRTASGGRIELLNFNINLGMPAQKQGFRSPNVLFSATEIHFERGAVSADQYRNMDAALRRGLAAPRASIKDVRHSGWERGASFDVGALIRQMNDFARYLREELPRYERAQPLRQPVFTGRGGLAVNHFTIAARDLDGANYIGFTGNDRELFIVHVTGRDNVNLTNTHFEMKGVGPGQVLFFFSEAPVLKIRATGVAVEIGWGIPASFLAPQTTLIFNRALITGSVWVRRIDSDSFDAAARTPQWPSSDPSGQINFACFPWARIGLNCTCR